MARKHFDHFEAISMALPADDAFEAVVAVRRRNTEDSPRVHHVAYGQRYDLVSEADAAAEAALAKVVEVSEEGELIWADELSEPSALDE